MKKLITQLFKMTTQVCILMVVFTSACAESKKEATSSNATQSSTEVAPPKVDIQTAIITGNLEAVQQHIKAGTNLNEKEALSGATPLISAATFNKPKIVQALIDAGADLSVKNNDGSTVLHVAAFFGRIEIVQLLMDAEADTTLRNNFGATPRETVLGDFAEIKPFYEMLIQQLQPMGFTLDMEELKKARPVVAMMLQ